MISWALLLALPLMAVIAALSLPARRGDIGAPAWAGLVYVSVFSMFVGFVFWYRGLALGGIASVGQLQLLQPFFGLTLAAALLHEPVRGPWWPRRRSWCSAWPGRGASRSVARSGGAGRCAPGACTDNGRQGHMQADETATGTWTRELAVALATVREAAAVVKTFYDRADAGVYEKADRSPLTDADLAADALIRSRVAAAFPDDGLLTEESADDPARLTKRRLWIADPSMARRRLRGPHGRV